MPPTRRPRHREARSRAWLRASFALVVLVLLLAAVPYGLWHLGTVPTSWPSWEQAWQVLRSPDDGTLLFTTLTLIGWACWLALVAALVLEAAALLQHRTARRRRGLAGLQGAAAWLLGSLVLLSTPAAAAATTTPAVAAAPATTPTHAAASADTSPPGDTHHSRPEHEPVHRVSADNPTLWGIAEQRLGEGTRWKDILALNPGLTPGGSIEPGTVLAMPSDTPPRTPASAGPATVHGDHAATDTHPHDGEADRARQYVVQPGDNLSTIAEEQLGEASRYPEIVDANPRQIEDPDLIFPGQELSLPTRHAGPQPPDTTPPEHPPEHPPEPRPEPDAGTDEDTDTSDQDGGAQPETATPTHTPDTGEDGDHPSPQPTHRPNPSGSTSDPTDEDETATGQVTALTATGGILAAGLLTTLWRRRVVQQRRRRRGRRIPMPQEKTAAAAEEELRAAPQPVEPAVLDGLLRALAADLAAHGRDLPVLQAICLSHDTVELHLDQPAPPAGPFTTHGDDLTRWQCPTTPVDPTHLQDMDPPYPGLVVLGTTGHQQQLLLVDLEHVGLLHLTGPDRHALARSIAVELAITPLADHLDVALLESAAPGLAAVCDRLDAYDHAEGVLTPLRTHHTEQQRALTALGATSLQQARLSHPGLGGWTPYIVIADDLEAGDLADMTAALETQPRSATAIVTTDATPPPAGAWVVHADRDQGPVELPGSGLLCDLHLMGEESYTDIVTLLATSDADEDRPPAAAPDHGLSPATPEHVPSSPPTEAAPPGPEAPWQDDPAQTGRVHADLPEQRPAANPLADLADLADEPAPEEPPDTLQPAEQPSTPTPPAPHTTPVPPHQPEAAATPPSTDSEPESRAQTAQPQSPQHSPGDAASPTAPVVRVLGPVDIVGVHGTIETKRVRTATELVAWLYLHPRQDRYTLEEALWRGRAVKGRTVTELISRTRKWLGTTDEGTYHFPIVADTVDARYALADTVDCDWNTFQDLVATGESTSGDEGTETLRQALELVRGRPFAGTPPNRYVWAEPLIQEIISEVVDAAELLAERYLVAGAGRDALWASAKGLEAAPEAEQLHRMKFQALHALGDTEGLRRAALELDTLNDDLGVEAEESTVELLRSLQATDTRRTSSR